MYFTEVTDRILYGRRFFQLLYLIYISRNGLSAGCVLSKLRISSKPECMTVVLMILFSLISVS